MRIVFWSLFAVFLLLGFVGLGAPSPMLEGVAGETLAEWYQAQLWWSLPLGAVLGAASAWLAPDRVRHRSDEDSGTYLNRVRWRGVLTVLGVLVLLAVFLFAVAYGYAAVPLAAMQRGGTLLFAAKSLLVIGFGTALAALAFAVVARVRLWGGAYALVSPNLLRFPRRN
jgi:hypothetical protein